MDELGAFWKQSRSDKVTSNNALLMFLCLSVTFLAMTTNAPDTWRNLA